MQNGWTQEQIAKRLGFSPSIWTRYEAGEFLPSLGKLDRMAELFGMSVCELLSKEVPVSSYLDSFTAQILPYVADLLASECSDILRIIRTIPRRRR